MPFFYHENIPASLNVKREKLNELSFGVARNPNVNVHFHSQIELYMITEGEIEVLINHRRRVLKKERSPSPSAMTRMATRRLALRPPII